MLRLNKFYLLLVFCLHFNEFTLAFMPTNTVWAHNAVLADSKIYFKGGIIPKFPNSWDGVSFSKEFYYLDVKDSFKIERGGLLPWVDLSSVSQILPPHSVSAFSLCGPNNDTLVMFGGSFAVEPERLVYTYELKLQQWSNPLTVNQPKNKHSRSVCDTKTGKMYMFSGFSDPMFLDIMDILNTWTLVWERGSSINAPGGRFDYTATLLSSGHIVYIGGVVASGVADMSKIPLYNINDDTWSTMNTPGYSPTPRGYHSAVLTKDGRIIVYGGYISFQTLIPVFDDLVVLDTTQTIFTWSRANVSTISPPSRFYHTASLVGDYMIVAFGRNNINLPSPETNEIFILYTGNKSDYKWVNEFIPPVPSPNPSPNPSTPSTISTSTPLDPSGSSQSINKNLIIGIVILSIVIALMGGLFLIHLYRKRQRSQPDLFISGNN